MMNSCRFVQTIGLSVLMCLFVMTSSGCYTQFASSRSISRAVEPTEFDPDELVEDNNGTIIINNYYDSYYNRFLRPTIYGFGGVWWDPFWDFPLWYSPVAFYGGWGWSPWHWNRWRWWGYPPYYWGTGGGVASIEPIGTRRMGIGRSRISGVENAFTPSATTRYGASERIVPSGSTFVPSRRQRGGSTESNASRRRQSGSSTRESKGSSSVERKSDSRSRSNSGGSSVAPRRQSSGGGSSSYSSPSQRGSSSSSSSGGRSSSSSSGSSGRRQR